MRVLVLSLRIWWFLHFFLSLAGKASDPGVCAPSRDSAFPHVARWYGFMHSLKDVRGPVEKALKQKTFAAKAQVLSGESKKGQQGGDCKKGKENNDTQASYEGARIPGVDFGGRLARRISLRSREASSCAGLSGKLEGAQEGKVVTRFPPEPSGYLHIGHAKAAMLNHYFATKYKGKMILRCVKAQVGQGILPSNGTVRRGAFVCERQCSFDDTNPVNETDAFEKSILEDAALLGVKWERVTYTSDYFEKLQEICAKMIERGGHSRFFVWLADSHKAVVRCPPACLGLCWQASFTLTTHPRNKCGRSEATASSLSEGTIRLPKTSNVGPRCWR